MTVSNACGTNRIRYKAEIVVLSAKFSDFDEFVGNVQGVDSLMLLQHPARHSWVLSASDLPGMRVQRGRMGSGNIVEGLSSREGYVIYLPFPRKGERTANGTPIEEDVFMVLEPGCEFCLNEKFEHDWCSIVVPTVALDAQAEPGEPAFPDDKKICRLSRPNPRLANQLRKSVRAVIETASKHPKFESSPASTVASAGLEKLGASILGLRRARPSHHPERQKVPHREIIRRSLEFLEEHELERTAVSELAAACQVSERTLRSAFHERYGTGPVRYLQVRNLHRIHRALKEADHEEATVAEILLQHGEWEFGRFASRYRRLFGALPSETLRAKRR